MLESYRTLLAEASAEFIEKRSRFIGYACPALDEAEALSFVQKIKNQHPDATHNVFAYIIKDQSIERFNDDGEPHGTAGMPVLDVLKKESLINAAVVVTRYFGGTLLGAGGLVRAYTHAAKIAVEASGIGIMQLFDEVRIACRYGEFEQLMKICLAQRAIIDGTDFCEDVIIRLALPVGSTNILQQKTADSTSGKAVFTVIGSRYDKLPLK